MHYASLETLASTRHPPVHSLIMKTAILLPKEDRRLLRGHVWAYRNEFATLPPLEDGEWVDILSHERRFIGRGFYQAEGGIAVRLISSDHIEPDGAFLNERIKAARLFRETLFPGSATYRWLHGESDGLPGLVADRYGAVVCAHSSCRFYIEYADDLLRAFVATPGVTGARLECCGKVIQHGDIPNPLECDFDGVRVAVNVVSGQKTGLFLDQRLNRKRMALFAAGRRVLDGHCHAGAWSAQAALAGATSVIGVDTSSSAIEQAQQTAELNGVGSTCAFECADILQVLSRSEMFDMIILDPPAFAKARSQKDKALGLYQSLNRDAIKIITSGGYLVSSSCSHFVAREEFVEMLKRAARAAQRSCALIELRGASPDHPVLLAMPETEYLTCAILRIW